jgi:hypothetical protein
MSLRELPLIGAQPHQKSLELDRPRAPMPISTGPALPPARANKPRCDQGVLVLVALTGALLTLILCPVLLLYCQPPEPVPVTQPAPPPSVTATPTAKPTDTPTRPPTATTLPPTNTALPPTNTTLPPTQTPLPPTATPTPPPTPDQLPVTGGSHDTRP